MSENGSRYYGTPCMFSLRNMKISTLFVEIKESYLELCYVHVFKSFFFCGTWLPKLQMLFPKCSINN